MAVGQHVQNDKNQNFFGSILSRLMLVSACIRISRRQDFTLTMIFDMMSHIVSNIVCWELSLLLLDVDKADRISH